MQMDPPKSLIDFCQKVAEDAVKAKSERDKEREKHREFSGGSQWGDEELKQFVETKCMPPSPLGYYGKARKADGE